jgi:hypothetical protein
MPTTDKRLRHSAAPSSKLTTPVMTTTPTATTAPAEIEWRRVLGAFQLTIPVKVKNNELRGTEERELSVLRWIAVDFYYQPLVSRVPSISGPDRGACQGVRR